VAKRMRQNPEPMVGGDASLTLDLTRLVSSPGPAELQSGGSHAPTPRACGVDGLIAGSRCVGRRQALESAAEVAQGSEPMLATLQLRPLGP
jgi:hypothetical protein